MHEHDFQFANLIIGAMKTIIAEMQESLEKETGKPIPWTTEHQEWIAGEMTKVAWSVLQSSMNSFLEGYACTSA